MYDYTTPIRYVRGVGPTKAKTLARAGIETVGDLLDYTPLSYIYPGATTIADAKEGHVVIKAEIRGIRRRTDYTNAIQATLKDDTGKCQAMWYNNAYILQALRVGWTVTFYGKMKGGVLQQPKWCTYEGAMENVYGGQYGTHHATIRAALKEVLANMELPVLHDGTSRSAMYFHFHFPTQKGCEKVALHELKLDELLCQQLALKQIRDRRERVKGVVIRPDVRPWSYLGHTPTEEQYKTVCEIQNDLASGHTMNRLLHGEVGSGKTLVAFYAAMLAALNGKRTLILCPTTILAQQHYDTLRGMGWEDVGLHSPNTFMTADTPNVIIGTHSILFDTGLVKSASLVIIDEFQKFGVQQRALATKYNPHLLLLSATPIPRSLASTVFGDLDVSTIRQQPISRGQVITRWVLPEKRPGMYEIVERELEKGHQVYVVYPRISGSEDVVSAERGIGDIRRRFDCDAELLIGRDSAEFKSRILRWFKTGEINILVSTIIAEVGLDNPNATVMIVEGADRFGLSQLHQLRGRICRSTDTAYCFLVAETDNQTSIDRLEVIERCSDGFEISEHDLRLRGPGELFSTRQHGLPDLKHASLVDDYSLIIKAKEMVQAGDIGEGVREIMQLKYDLELGGTI